MAAAAGDGARARVRAELGSGDARVQTGVPLLDHALTLLAAHARLDLEIDAAADAGPDDVAAIGRALGEQLAAALREPGAPGHGSASVPADEALALVSLEASGRPLLVSNVDLSHEHVAGLATDLVSRFLRELADGAGLTLHVRLVEGDDTRHVLDAMFKSLGAAIGEAIAARRAPDPLT